ncbi:MAG: serine/threonine protein kinase [Thermoleophilia bacterium]|nr:serine/threonine protein kinase [Thermoleophilia bacterium]
MHTTESRPSAHPRHEPVRVLGRYDLQEVIGRGATSRVHRALDRATGRAVAVKVIPVHLGLEKRVAAEIRAAARLEHRSVVRMLDWGEDADSLYLVSELVDGSSLESVYAEAPPGDRATAAMAADVLEALQHAHERGVVHRDIKPANILVGRDGHARVADLGVARLSGESGMTQTGGVVGTMAYMAPEQATGEAVTGASDVWAATLVLYEGLTGRNPILGAGPADTARRAALGEVPPIRQLRPDLPDRLTRAIDAGLSPRPESRPRADELARVIRESAHDLPEGRGRRAMALLSGPLPPILTGVGVGLLGGLIGAQGMGAGTFGAVGIGLVAGGIGMWRAPVAALALVLLAAAAMATSAPALTGVAVAVALVLVMTGGRYGRLILLPILAPVLAMLGLLPVYALMAGSVRTIRGRIWTILAGMVSLLMWQIIAGTSHFVFTGWEVASAWDVLEGVPSPITAGEVLIAPIQAHPAAITGCVIVAVGAFVWPLVMRRTGTTRVAGSILWAAGITIAVGMLGGGDLDAVGAVIPSAILAIAWATRPWRALLRGDPGRGTSLSRTIG